MHSHLLLPRIDADIAHFVKNYPRTDKDFVPSLDNTSLLGIIYCNRIYREIVCNGREEFEAADQFLMDTGYIRRVDTSPKLPHYRLYELID